jgi:hypothetical protein
VDDSVRMQTRLDHLEHSASFGSQAPQLSSLIAHAGGYAGSMFI